MAGALQALARARARGRGSKFQPCLTERIEIDPLAEGPTGSEGLWLSQALMAELFQTTPQNVTQHLKAIYAEGELKPEATCKDFLQVRQEGARVVARNVDDVLGQVGTSGTCAT